MSDAARTVRIVYSTNAKPALDEATKAKNEAAKAARELATAERQTATESASLLAQYQRLTGSLDPVVANTHKYESAQRLLDASLQRGLITQQQYNATLEASREKFLAAGESTGFFESALEGMGEKIRESITELAVMAIGFLTVEQAVEQVKKSVEAFSEFQSTLLTIQANSGTAADEMHRISDEAKLVGSTTEFKANDAASGLKVLMKAGFDTADALGQLKDAEHLGTIAQTSLKESADDLALSLVRFNLPASESTHVVDTLATVTAHTRASMGDMVDTMKTAGPAASAVGIKFDDLAAVLGVVANNGGNVRQAGSLVVNALATLSEGGKKVDADLKRLNLTLADVSPQTHSLTQIITTFARANLDAATASDLFGKKGGLALLDLTTKIPQLLQLQAAITGGAIAGEHMAAVIEGGLEVHLKTMANAVDAVRVSVGEGMAPAVLSAADDWAAFARDGSASAVAFGQSVGTVVSAVSGSLLFLANNIAIIKTGVETFLLLRAAEWFTGVVAAVGASASSLLGLGAAEQVAAAGAGEVVVTTQGEAAAMMELTAATDGAEAASAKFLAVGLNPLTIGLTAVAAVLLFLNERTKEWGNTLQAETDRMVKDVNKHAESMAGLKKKYEDLTSTILIQKAAETEAAATGVTVGSDAYKTILLQKELEARRSLAFAIPDYSSKLKESSEQVEAERKAIAESQVTLQAAEKTLRDYSAADTAAGGTSGYLQRQVSNAGAAVRDARKNVEDHIIALREAQQTTARLTVETQGMAKALSGLPEAPVTKPNPIAREKVKSDQSVMDSVAAALRTYAEKLEDVRAKEDASTATHNLLMASLGQGLNAYELEKKALEADAAGNAAVKVLYDANRAAIDKLTDARTKLEREHKSADAAKVQAGIDALTDSYLDDAEAAYKAAAGAVKHKNDEAASVAVLKDSASLTASLALANAQYADALHGNTAATRENAAAVEARRIVDVNAAQGVELNYEAVLKLTRARRADIDAIHDQTTEQVKITGLFKQADYQVAISRIDTSTSAAVQQLEASYLALLTDSGKQTIAKTEAIWTELAAKAGLSLAQYEANVRTALQDLQDASTVKKYAGGGISIYQQYVNERTEIERLMTASSDKVHLTVADGLKALQDLHNKYIDSQLSTYSSALGILSQEFGGVFTKLLRFVQILQEIQTLREDVSAIISGLGGLGAVFGSAATATTTNTSAIVALTASVNANSAALGTSSATSSAGSIAGGAGGGGAAAGAGGALAIVGAFVAAYLVGTQILNVRDRHGFGAASSYQVTNGQAVEAGETAIAESIRKFVKTIEDLAGSTITELDSIGIKVQNSGKAFRAYVGSTLIGEFGTLQEALGAAVQRALSTAQFSKALDPAIKDLISGAAAGFSGNIDDFLASLKLVTDGINQSLPKAASDFRALNVNFDQTFEAQLALFRTHAAAGLQELFGLDLAHWAAGVDDLRDSITGQQKSAYILFEQQRQAFNAENDARRLSILTQIAKTKTDLLAAGVTVATINQITGALNGLKSISAGSGGPGAGDTPGGTLHYNYGQGPTGPNGGAIPGDPGAGHPAPGGNPATIPGFAGQNTANLEALLAELVKELGALPDNIKSSEFNNAQSKNYYSNQLDSAEKDFEKLASDLASAGKSAAEFSSDLSADLANLGLTLNDQRDAITGHKRTAAEDLAIRKEQAIQWDAELVLRKANVAQEIIDLQVKIDGAKGQIAYTSVMVQSGQYIARTAVGVAKTVGAAGGFTEAQITAMEQQLDALKGIQGVLDGIKLIDPSEILLGGSGGSGAQQKADALAALNAELEKLGRSGLPSAVGAIVDLGLQLADLTKRTHDAHASELLLAQARKALIDQAKANILSPLLGYLKPNEAAGGTLGVSQFGTAASGIDKQFADAEAAQRKLIETTGQRAVAFWVLQEAHVRALHAAAEQFIGGLGLPVEQARDKVAALQGSLGSLWEAFGRGAIDGQRLTDVLNQMTAQSGSELLGLAQSLLSTMGQTTEAAKVKAALDEADFDIKVIQLNILYQGYLALSQVSDQVKATLDHALGIINDPKNHPDFQAIELAAIAQKNTGAANTQLQAANDNLAAADKLTQWQQSLLTNPAVSPLAPRAQVAQSRADLNALIAKAEAGDQSSRDRFTQEADAYLSLYRSTFGMTGDYAKEIMSLSGVADVLKAELLGNPAQNLATGPPAWYYGPDVGGSSSGTGPTAGGPGSGYVAPNVPVVTVDIGPIVSALGKSGDLYILTRDAGADAIRYHVAALDLYRTIAERLGSIDNRMADMNSSLQRVINKIAA